MKGNTETLFTELRKGYELAIQECDIEKILHFGTAYYSYIRGGKMTAADREILHNELMMANVNNSKKKPADGGFVDS